MEIRTPRINETDDSPFERRKKLNEMLIAMDWRFKDAVFEEGEEYGVAKIEYNKNPNEMQVKIECEQGCGGVNWSFNEPSETMTRGRLLYPAMVMRTREWMKCALYEKMVHCVVPGETVSPAHSEQPRVHYSGTAEMGTDEFDGVLYIRESIGLGVDGDFKQYRMEANYTPPENDGYFKQLLSNGFSNQQAGEIIAREARKFVCKGLATKLPYEKVDVIDGNER